MSIYLNSDFDGIDQALLLRTIKQATLRSIYGSLKIFLKPKYHSMNIIQNPIRKLLRFFKIFVKNLHDQSQANVELTIINYAIRQILKHGRATNRQCILHRLLNHGIPLTSGMIVSVQVQYDRLGHKRGRQLNILADKKLYEFCAIRKFELQFTGEKLQCITQAEKARLLAAKSQARQQTSAPNRTTFGQYRRQGPDDNGKRPRN
jgi:hypothetical protein